METCHVLPRPEEMLHGRNFHTLTMNFSSSHRCKHFLSGRCDVELATKGVVACVFYRELREVLSISAETTTADLVDLKLVNFLPDGFLVIFLHCPQGWMWWLSPCPTTDHARPRSSRMVGKSCRGGEALNELSGYCIPKGV